MSTAAKQYKHDLAVEFGGVSIGDETASVGISFDRNGHTLDGVEALLCGKRLDVYAVVGDTGDPKQQRLPGIDADPRPHVAASCDSKKIAVSPKAFGARLKFSLREIDVKEIAGLAKRSGTVRLTVLGDVPDAADDDPDPDGEFDDAVRPAGKRQRRIEPAPAVPVGVDPADHDPIETLASCGLSKKQCEKIRESKLECKTVGDLIRAIGANEWWHRDIKGIGKANIDKVTDAILEYRRRAPAPDPDAAPKEGGEVAAGEPCPNVNRYYRETDGYSVGLAVTPGPEFRAVCDGLYGAGVKPEPTPTLDLPAFPSRDAAIFAASGPLIDQWMKGDAKKRKAAVEVKEWVDSFVASAVPEDVPV